MGLWGGGGGVRKGLHNKVGHHNGENTNIEKNIL